MIPWRWVQGGSSAIQTADYKGTPLEAGIWHVNANESLDTAQKTRANLLAGLDGILNEIKPDLVGASFKLQLDGSGKWTLRIDLKNDGVIDLDVTSEQTGNKRSPLTAMTEASGLIVSTRAAMGSNAGYVGRTAATIRYRQSATAPVTSLTNRRPFSVIVPATSKVSPTTVEGDVWKTGYTVQVTGPTLPTAGATVSYLGATTFFAEVPLRVPAQGATPVTFKQSGTPTTDIAKSITWAPVLMANNETISVRRGDSILLNFDGPYDTATTVTGIDADGNGTIDFTGNPTSVFPLSVQHCRHLHRQGVSERAAGWQSHRQRGGSFAADEHRRASRLCPPGGPEHRFDAGFFDFRQGQQRRGYGNRHHAGQQQPRSPDGQTSPSRDADS